MDRKLKFKNPLEGIGQITSYINSEVFENIADSKSEKTIYRMLKRSDIKAWKNKKGQWRAWQKDLDVMMDPDATEIGIDCIAPALKMTCNQLNYGIDCGSYDWLDKFGGHLYLNPCSGQAHNEASVGHNRGRPCPRQMVGAVRRRKTQLPHGGSICFQPRPHAGL